MTVFLDFETYWDPKYKLKTSTTEGYVRDPRFEVIGVGVKWGWDRPSIWLEEGDFREWAARVDWSRVTLVCHHTHFDGFILSHHYGIRPGFLVCTMSMGRAVLGPAQGVSLDALAKHFQVGEKGKEILKTQGKHRRDFTEADWLAFGDYCNNDNELTARILRCMLRGFPPEELWQIDSTIRMFTEPLFEANQAILETELRKEKAKKVAVLQAVGRNAGIAVPEGATVEQALEATRAVLSSNDQFAELLRSMGEEVPLKANPKGQLIPAFAKNDPGMQELLEHPRDEIRALAEARLAVKSTLVETRTERLIGIAQRGAVPFYLKYCGAHTHRWSGGDKMNPQNFNRGGALRDAILAPEGWTLAVGDLSQIEARMVAWLARQMELLETFRRNDALGEAGDFYSDEGSRFFRRKISKKDKERQIAKALILGLGFGMGWLKCALELLKGMLGTPPVQFTQEDADTYGVDVEAFAEYAPAGQPSNRERVEGAVSRLPFAALLVHCAVADYFVRLYRRTNSKIAALWKAMNKVLEVMEKPDGDPHTVRMTLGPIKVIRHALVKPNGLILHYPGLKRSKHGFSYMGGAGGRKRVKVYGGLLTENVVQSLARDVIAEHALWIRAEGYRLGTTTHDEVVSIPREADGETCLRFMLARMKIAPAWCADLPLNASGGVARRYGDAK